VYGHYALDGSVSVTSNFAENLALLVKSCMVKTNQMRANVRIWFSTKKIVGDSWMMALFAALLNLDPWNVYIGALYTYPNLLVSSIPMDSDDVTTVTNKLANADNILIDLINEARDQGFTPESKVILALRNDMGVAGFEELVKGMIQPHELFDGLDNTSTHFSYHSRIFTHLPDILSSFKFMFSSSSSRSKNRTKTAEKSLT